MPQRRAHGTEPGVFGRGRPHRRVPAAALKLLQGVAVAPAQTAARGSGSGASAEGGGAAPPGADSHPVFLSSKVNLCYLCQTCTYLLHSKKMLHHYLQVGFFPFMLPGKLVEAEAPARMYMICPPVIFFFRLKMGKRCPPDRCRGHSGPHTLRLKSRRAEGRRAERRRSRRPCWRCSAAS